MLIAVIKNHSNNKDKLTEDEISSSVFGPLSYLDVKDLWIFFRILLKIGPSSFSKLWPSGNPDENEILFWHNNKTGKVQKVIPDLVIKFKKQGRYLLTLLIEVKWRSHLSGEDQLIKQWRSISEDEHKKTLHIYLVKDLNKGKEEIKKSLSAMQDKFKKSEWEERLVCMDWHLITFALENSQDLEVSSAFRRWWNDIADFLDRMNIPRFHGFKHLSGYKLRPIGPHSLLFWRPFKGFQFIQRIPIRLLGSLKEGPLFYYGNHK